jgi:hypothetical protein
VAIQIYSAAVMKNISAIAADEWEPHYTIPFLAEKWNMSNVAVREWFRDEPDVLRIGDGALRPGKKRALVHLRIPLSVARRVYLLHTGRPAKLPRR